MKITATRYEDLQKAKSEYDAETKKMTDVIDEQERTFRRAQNEAKQNIERQIADLIGPSSLKLEITADPWGRYGSDSWAISVRANEHNKFDDNVALAWNWDVYTNEKGEVLKDSGSWSGLKVTTPEQIADLEESVRVMKLLNNMDWNTIINSPRPEYNEFVDHDLSTQIRDRKNQRPAFEKDMLDARLEDLIGKNVLIQLKGDEYYRGNVGILLTGMSDKFLKGYIVPWSMAKDSTTVDEIKKYAYEPRRTSKDKILKQDGMPIEFEVQG